jgi:hypothetical protein
MPSAFAARARAPVLQSKKKIQYAFCFAVRARARAFPKKKNFLYIGLYQLGHWLYRTDVGCCGALGCV